MLDEDENQVLEETNDMNDNGFIEINANAIDQEETVLGSLDVSAAKVKFFKKIISDIQARGGAKYGPKEYSAGNLWAKKQPDAAFSVLDQVDPSVFYEPDTFLWFPHLLFGNDKSKKLVCPECKHDLFVKGFNDESIARRIIDVDR